MKPTRRHPVRLGEFVLERRGAASRAAVGEDLGKPSKVECSASRLSRAQASGQECILYPAIFSRFISQLSTKPLP